MLGNYSVEPKVYISGSVNANMELARLVHCSQKEQNNVYVSVRLRK